MRRAADSGLDIAASNIINRAQGTQTIGPREAAKPASGAWDGGRGGGSARCRGDRIDDPDRGRGTDSTSGRPTRASISSGPVHVQS